MAWTLLMAAVPLLSVTCGESERTPTSEARSVVATPTSQATVPPNPAPAALPTPVETAAPAPTQAATVASSPTPIEILDALGPSVVRVFAQRSSRTGLLGSGVVLDTEGHILTSYEVVKDAEAIVVTPAGGEGMEGELVGLDRVTGLAVVRVDNLPLAPAAFGDSSAVEVWQGVVSIGYEFAGDWPVLREGVVTLTDSTYVMDPQTTVAALIESDALVPLAGMGGPMVNNRGEVIGIHVGHALDPLGGMAVKINDALEVAAQLIAQGYVVRSVLGVVALDVNESLADIMGLPTTTGILVVDVLSGAAAELAGLDDRDVIVGLDDAPIASSGDLGWFLMAHAPGLTVVVTYYRDGEERSTELVLGESPE
ncbi:MAG: trypsin-like peptidase domain-containing protein [Chloroflexi bacterium]|nr:trypsin-like peptidase domain-containing protein [Chloroflexota bacterium]